MSNDTSIEVISTLLKRRDLMEEIVSGPVRRTDLCGELELSRSTIYRGLDQLAELGLVMDQTGTYESTKYGSMIYDKYLEFEKFVSKLSISQNLVETIYSLEPSPLSLFSSKVQYILQTSISQQKILNYWSKLLLNPRASAA